MGGAALVIGPGILGVELDSTSAIVDGLSIILHPLVADAPVMIGAGIRPIQRDRGRVISDRQLETSLVVMTQAFLVINLRHHFANLADVDTEHMGSFVDSRGDRDEISVFVDNRPAARSGANGRLGFEHIDPSFHILVAKLNLDAIGRSGLNRADGLNPHGRTAARIADQQEGFVGLRSFGGELQRSRFFGQMIELNNGQVMTGVRLNYLTAITRRFLQVISAIIDQLAVSINREKHLNLFLSADDVSIGDQ